jgi:hypothetical protein
VAFSEVKTQQPSSQKVPAKKMGTLLSLLTLFIFPSTADALWWALNYIPTADTWYEKTLAFQFYEYGYTDGKIYGYVNNSFGSSDAQIYGLSAGLPSLTLGDQWKIDSDIGVDFYRPDSDYYDETALNFKVKFIQEEQFNSFCPAVAFGGAYLGGGIDLYIRPSDPHADLYPDRAVKKSRKSDYPSFYLVASKNIPVKYIEPQLTAGFMWNNFGSPKEDVPIVGLSGWLLPRKVLLMGDYYGGDFGNYGLGLYLLLHDKLELGISYLFPKDKDYPIKNFQSESLWIYVNLYVPLKRRK